MAKPYFSTPLISLDPVVLDTETTGLDVLQARIVQIGAVHIRSGQLDREDLFNTLINPDQPIPEPNSAIHGITDDMVAEAPRFGDVSDNFSEYMGDAALLGHNIGFDIAMVKREFALIDREWPVPPSLDTMALARIANPMLPNYSLEVVASWLGCDVEYRHTAIGDAHTTARIFLALVPLLRAAGVRTIADAQRASAELSQHPSAQSGYAARVDSIGAVHHSDSLAAIRRIDSYPFQYRVRDVMSAPALIIEPTLSPAQLATILADQNKSAAFVLPSDTNGSPGIVTERDLMRLLAGKTVETVGEVANAPLQTIGDDAFIYQALGHMHRAAIRHLGVTGASGEIVGALTSGDLLRQRADDAIAMSGNWAAATDSGALAANWGRLPVIARSLLDEGVDAPGITAVLGEQLAAVTRRAAELAEMQMIESGKGEAPTAYAVLLLGSGSRGETLLAPDQDNAIVYADGCDDAESWFAAYGKILADLLDEAGVTYCQGGIMGSNPEWRKDLSGWKATIQDWLGQAVWKELLNVDIFYDFQPVHGDEALAYELQDYAYEMARKTPTFIRQLSAMATSFGSPLGFMGRFRTEAGRVDLKGGGTLPIVSGARVLALRHGIREQNTRRRIEGVKGLDLVSAEDLDEILGAHELLLRLILEQQLKDMAAGISPSNKVDIRALSKRSRSRLRQALETVSVMPMAMGEPLGSG